FFFRVPDCFYICFFPSYYQQLYDKAVQLGPPVRSDSNSGKRTRRMRLKRQARAFPRCVRKEYRMLSDDERRRFHNAINALKQDTTVEPNKYDAIALLHTGMASFTAHGGAGFPGWHRIYILMFETALREVDPSVCLPYWDSSLDNELDDPTESHIWTADFFGTQQGPVLEGPFANWVTPDGSQLMRNVGTDGDLFTASSIEGVLSRSRHDDIVTSENVDPQFDLEFHHAAVHVFCGGTMGQLDTAAFDPIFFMLHSYVDYLWELFRTNLRSLGIDPEDYPNVLDADSRHHSTAATGFGDLTQADGYLDSLTDSYEYESAPICTARFPNCGSSFISSRLGNPKTFKRCNGDDDTGQVFLSSNGLNYDGFYKEAAIIDQRLAVSMSMGFVAIKRPTRGSMGVSKALIRAHDSCGRVCHAACKNDVTGKYEQCSGAVALSTDAPLMYGSNYDEAVMSVFDYEFNNDCPNFKTESFFLTFYCDFHNEFPYADHKHAPVPAPAHRVPVPEPEAPVEMLPFRDGCQVTSNCVLDVPCASRFVQCHSNNEKHLCHGSCRAYGVCTYGRYFLRVCPDGKYFDDVVKTCVVGFCRKVPGAERILDRRRADALGLDHSGHGHSHRGSPHRSEQTLPEPEAEPQSTGRQPDRPFYSQLLSGFLRQMHG
ncbi:hypothetical protein EGW08_002888, partial [Elysia chlorotica]